MSNVWPNSIQLLNFEWIFQCFSHFMHRTGLNNLTLLLNMYTRLQILYNMEPCEVSEWVRSVCITSVCSTDHHNLNTYPLCIYGAMRQATIQINGNLDHLELRMCLLLFLCLRWSLNCVCDTSRVKLHDVVAQRTTHRKIEWRIKYE